MERSPAMDSNPKENLDAIRSKTPSTLRRVGMYALARILTIGITIVVGIFAAVVVANKGGGIDASVSSSLRDIAQQQAWSLGQSLSFEERQEATSKYYEELLENSGINDPFLKKHIRWTWNALQLELGEAIYTRLRATYVVQQQRDDIKAIVLSHLPNTLALVGLADFFVFAIGIPLSLYLSQNYGNWIDKTINFLSPLSSVPSWVHGVLLILIFAVTLRVLPPGGMIDVPIPDTRLGVLASRLKHMILPSLALFLSLMFQLVYTWRNYFMIYSNEDYVEYAVSKGLSNSTIRNKYILRPTMPYVLTSFALTLVSFWQMATALEVVFDWDGIGSMYILSLPNFFGESMFPGEMGLTIGIVVIFAYILGLVVFLLDISYAVVDPRIRLEGTQQRIKPTRGKRNYNILNWFKSFSSNISKKPRSAESSSGRAEKAIAKKNTRSSKLVLIFFLLLIIGITVGLAFGWWIWPVELINAAPADLHPNYQADYIRLVIDAFNSNQDSALAQRRLDALGDQAAPALNNFLESIDSDAAALESISRFAANFKLAENSLPQASTDVVPQENGRLDRKLITLVVLFAGLAAIAIGSFYLYQRRYQHPENSKLAKKHKKTSGKSGSGTPQPEPTLPSSRKRLKNVFREMIRYPSAVVGMVILLVMVLGSLYAVVRYPYREIATSWFEDIRVNPNVPRTAYPQWVNFFLKDDFPETIINNSAEMPETKSVKILENGNPDYTFTFEFEYPYMRFPTEGTLYFDAQYESKKPFATFTWFTPDGREFQLDNAGITDGTIYRLNEHLNTRQLADHKVRYKFSEHDIEGVPVLYGLFTDPEKDEPVAVPGTYTMEIKILGFEPDTQVDIEMVLIGEVYGLAGTDFMRRDLLVPLLWGMPFALVIGLFGALLTTIVSMMFAAFGVWFGGWADSLVQRVTEANMIMPVVAIAVLFYAFYGVDLWTILTVIVILNAFGGPTKTFRAAFLQVKEAGYIEAAQAYGAPNRRIIFRYMIPRILPVLIPQLVTLIPGFIFLEATLGMFNVQSVMPTWGKVIYEALYHGAAWGSKFWVLEPIALLLLTGFAFSMMGFALDRVLNPRLQQGD